MYLLSAMQLLKLWNQINYCYPHFFFHIEFYVLLAFTTATAENSQRYSIIKGNVACMSLYWKYLKLLIFTVSDICHCVFLKILKYPRCHFNFDVLLCGAYITNHETNTRSVSTTLHIRGEEVFEISINMS